MNNNINVLLLAKRWEHHTKSGGYDRLAHYLEGKKVFTQKTPIDYSSFSHRVWNKLVPSNRYVNQYEWVDMVSEVSVLWKSRTTSIELVHALYGEDQLNYLVRFKNQLNSTLVATFHMPVETEYVQKAIAGDHYKNLKNLDGAIVVSESMRKDLEQWVGKGKVYTVPHGIDTTVFAPLDSVENTSGKLNILSVGHHGRDWNTIREILTSLTNANVDFNYNAVIDGDKIPWLDDFNEAHAFENILESELITLYQQADVLLLPVHFGTANNSILESLACGTPVISTHVGGIPEYVDEKSGWLFQPGDSHGMITLIKEMSSDPDITKKKADEARKKALTLDWARIAESVREVYSEILKK